MPWFPTWLTHLTFDLPEVTLPPWLWESYPTISHVLACSFLMATRTGRLWMAPLLADGANLLWEAHQSYTPHDLSAALCTGLAALFLIYGVERLLQTKLLWGPGRNNERDTTRVG